MRSAPARGGIGLRLCSRHEGLFIIIIIISIDKRRENEGKNRRSDMDGRYSKPYLCRYRRRSVEMRSSGSGRGAIHGRPLRIWHRGRFPRSLWVWKVKICLFWENNLKMNVV